LRIGEHEPLALHRTANFHVRNLLPFHDPVRKHYHVPTPEEIQNAVLHALVGRPQFIDLIA
jgi:hypothetical protein